jgi:hypothetical protein
MDRTVRVRFQAMQDFSLLLSVQTDAGDHQTPYPTGTGGSLPVGKAAGPRETYHSPPSSVQVKNGGAIPPLPHMAHYLTK